MRGLLLSLCLAGASSLLACEDPVEPQRPAAIALTVASFTIYLGESQGIRYAVLDENGDTLRIPIRFTSENEAVASVNAWGVVKAINVGSVRIRLEIDNQAQPPLTQFVSVSVEPQFRLTLVPDLLVMTVGSVATLEARSEHSREGLGAVGGLGTMFSVGDSAMITLESPTGVTAHLRDRGRYVTARRPGRTLVIASFQNVTADTAAVVVRDPS
jgi:hypothetical protein